MALLRMLAFAPEGGALPAGKSEIPAASASARAAAGAPDLKKKLTDADWNALVHQLPLAGMERMLAHNCELIAWQEERIELRVPHAQRHLVDRAYQERLKRELEQHLGAKVRLEISVGAGNGNTLAEIQDRESQQRLSVAAAAIDGDPFVRDLIEKFDARVVSSTIKPVP